MSFTQEVPLEGKSFKDLDLDATVELLFSGSINVYAVEINNEANTSDVFFKAWNSIAVTIGSAKPDICLRVPAGDKFAMVFDAFGNTDPHLGITFGTGLSVACVTTGGTGGSTAPSSPVKGTIKTS